MRERVKTINHYVALKSRLSYIPRKFYSEFSKVNINKLYKMKNPLNL